MAANARCPYCQSEIRPTWGDVFPRKWWLIKCRSCGRHCQVSFETMATALIVGAVCMVVTIGLLLWLNVPGFVVLLGVGAACLFPPMAVARRIMRLELRKES